jgi:exosortase/archaeosortase family protein
MNIRKKRSRSHYVKYSREVENSFGNIFVRYFILLIIAVPNLYIFYTIFTPVTLYPVYYLFKIFFGAVLVRNVIYVKCIPIELINPCIAGSAYYLLSILNLSTPEIAFKKRIKMLLLAFLLFLLVNILRIFFLSMLLISNSPWFDLTHEIFWYFVSVLFVVGIWFAEVKYFKIKKVPIYSDLKFLYNNSSLKKKKR